jgi:1,4-dihydroxy-2-naphthoate octaprenyltransferase
MVKLKTWVSAARLRTLPLSVSGILVGTALAIEKGAFDWAIFSYALLTTLGLQILSNFANDYGDGVKGTDNETRTGPLRALQSGLISPKEMKTAMFLVSILTLVFAVLLIYSAFGYERFWHSLFFFLLGVLAIAAAIKYTVGKSAYGYRGLGDVFVFVFFGLVSVVGVYFLYAKMLSGLVFLPAVAIGFLSTAVLNLNNMRDRVGDKASGKITLVVKLGGKVSKNYHYLLIIGAFLAMLLFLLMTSHSVLNFICLVAFIPLFIHLKTVHKNEVPKALDPELKKVALSTFLLAVLFLAQAVWF